MKADMVLMSSSEFYIWSHRQQAKRSTGLGLASENPKPTCNDTLPSTELHLLIPQVVAFSE